MSKRIRLIVLAVLAVAAVIWGICNIRFTSVEEHEQQQQSARDAYLVENTTKQQTKTQTQTQLQTQSETHTIIENETVSESQSADSEIITENNKQDDIEQIPVKSEAPKPVQTEAESIKQEYVSCSISIECNVLNRDLSVLSNANLREYVPGDGQILATTQLRLPKGSSVYDALEIATMGSGIQMDATHSALYNSYYVKGINYLYEKNAGDRSGWIYKVNGISARVGASAYILSDGDEIGWHYTITGEDNN